jgi:hypothetical protein
MKKIRTWANRSEFRYDGSVTTGTTIYYGSNSSIVVTADQYSSLLQQFKCQTPNIGTSRDRAPKGGVGNWLQQNVTPTAIASYIGAILIDEGYAIKGAKKATIKFC